MSAPSSLRASATLVLALLAVTPSCDKSAEAPSTTPDAAAPADPVDATTDAFLAKMAEGDFDGTLAMAVSPLSEDLTAEAFADLSKSVAWLGYVAERETKSDTPVQGGTRRMYVVSFEKGEVNLEITVVGDKVEGFHFFGDDFEKAEHGVIADQFREFKVYGFRWTDEEGTDNPGGATFDSKKVAFRVVVGGLEAVGGQHHVNVEKRVLDANGKELFKEPIEYDVVFEANAEGIPKGDVGGQFEVPRPGKYTLELQLTDDVSHADTTHRVEFEVSAGAK